MPTFVYGDLWEETGRANLILVTTNSYINKQGNLVMGRGAAREAALRYPSLAWMLGQRVESACGHLGVYHLLLGLPFGPSEIGAFQVKRHFRDDADPELIGGSVDALIAHSRRYRRIAMNYPGIGNGHLDVVRVAPVIACLPDNVWVYRKLSERP